MTKKEDEIKLLKIINERDKEKVDYIFSAEELIEELKIPEKRFFYILSKFAKQNIINYGTSLRFFWKE